MSVDALVAAIEREADEEAGRLLAAADEGAAGRVAQAESAARTRLAATLAAAEPGIRGAEARTLNAARARLAGRRAARLVARTESAFELAETRLSALVEAAPPQDRWHAAIRGLVAETAAIVGPGSELRVRPADAEAVRELADRLERVGTRLVADPGMAAGVVGRSADGRLVVDATLPVRLGRSREALMAQVAARLRGDGSR